MKPVIEIENLTAGYRDRIVLREINLKVYEGEILSIVGPNGSGKTTLLKCIVGIIKPRKGKIRILGRDLDSITRRELYSIISYLPQETTPPPSLMTVYEYVLLGRVQSLAGKLTVCEEDHEAVIETAKMLGIEDKLSRRMSELSGGERQLIYIAQSLVKKPRVLLLDEPLNHLDLRNQLRVLKLLRELVCKMNLTVIIVMHDLNQAARYSDRIVLMTDGKIVCEGTPDEVLIPELLEKVYDVKFRVVYDDKVPQVIPTE